MKKILLSFVLIALLATGCNPSKNEPVSENSDMQTAPTRKDVKTYINGRYKYQFEYPEEATVSTYKEEFFSSNSSDTPEAAYKRLGGEVCITTRYKNGYVTISAPENNKDFNATCLRTGVGTEAEFSTEQITVEQNEIMGNKIFERTLETISYELSNGTRIEIGGGGETEQDYQEYLKIKPALLKIIESYKSL